MFLFAIVIVLLRLLSVLSLELLEESDVPRIADVELAVLVVYHVGTLYEREHPNKLQN